MSSAGERLGRAVADGFAAGLAQGRAALEQLTDEDREQLAHIAESIRASAALAPEEGQTDDDDA